MRSEIRCETRKKRTALQLLSTVDAKILNTSCLQKGPRQTVQTQIRLLSEEAV